tara:strand:- start:679 stop:1746 length:1068 start_codon:yes stop_codon:yes gene_type:complete
MYWNIVRLKFDWGDIQTQADIAERVGCDQSTVSRTMSRWNDTGNPIPGGRSSKGASRRLGKLATAAMILMVENNPDMYIREIRDELQIKVGHLLSFSKICRALRDNKFSVKVLERIAKERDAQGRFIWRETVRLLSHESLVFIDESHFDNTNVRRRRGRSRRGSPAIAVSSLGSKQSLSLIAAVTVNGMLLPACQTYEGGVDHTVLYSWAEEHLLPNLPPGSTLVLDNASIHHDDAFIELLDRAVLDMSCGLINYVFLSPYSPDYNPIERCFAQIKQWLRSRQEIAIKDVEAAVLNACATITSSNARNYFRAAGLSQIMSQEDITTMHSNSSWDLLFNTLIHTNTQACLLVAADC